MARLRKTQEDDIKRAVFGVLSLPINKLLLIYARQSTKKQVIHNRESWRQQQQDLQEQGLEWGWTGEKTVMFIENVNKKGVIKNVSGTLRIDQREGLSAVVEYIQRGNVGAVLVVDISRLFRDEDMVEPMVFAKLCREHNVLILTLDDTYNFNDERRDDLARFYLEAKAAADFIKKHVRGKMLKGRMNKAKRGEHASGTPPVGFAVLSHMTPIGIEKEPQYTPTPHAPYVQPLYQRFQELDANLAALYREVVGTVVFPDVPGWTPEHRIYLTRVEGGWTIKSRSGLKYILTNPAYIGHYVFDGKVMKRNAHPAIVDEKLFMFAWEHLSDTDIDGNPIERPERAVRYSQTGTMNEALLAGVREDGRPVIEGVGGKQVYVLNHTGSKSKSKPAYEIRDMHKLVAHPFEASIVVSDLDALVVDRLLTRLRVSRHLDKTVSALLPERGRMMHDVYEQVEKADKQATTVTPLDKSIAETETAITGLERRIHVAGDVMDDKELRDSYASLARLRTNLTEMVNKRDQKVKVEAAVQQAQADLCQAPDCFHKWDIERQRNLIHLVTDSITLEQIEVGWFRLVIAWCPFSGIYAIDTAYIWRMSGSTWTDNELAVLRAYYPAHPRMEVQQMLPARSWLSIKTKASDGGIRREAAWETASMPASMSLLDRMVLERYELPANEPGKRVWWQLVANLDDEEQLL